VLSKPRKPQNQHYHERWTTTWTLNNYISVLIFRILQILKLCKQLFKHKEYYIHLHMNIVTTLPIKLPYVLDYSSNIIQLLVNSKLLKKISQKHCLDLSTTWQLPYTPQCCSFIAGHRWKLHGHHILYCTKKFIV
jgi:hypothetical protein